MRFTFTIKHSFRSKVRCIHIRHLVAPIGGRRWLIVATGLLHQEHDVLLSQHTYVQQQRCLQSTNKDMRVHQSIVLGPGQHEEQPRHSHDHKHECKHDKVRPQFVMNSPVRVHATDDLCRGHVEECVYDNHKRNRREEYSDAQAADRLLVLYYGMSFGSARVQEVMREYRNASHYSGHGPRVPRVPTVLLAVCYTQEDVAGSRNDIFSLY